jgi:threonine/homoserine/homoserine lactone efflux protein
MTLELWLAYVLAASILLLLPGPTVLLVMGYALSDGRGSAWRSVPGVMAGDATAIGLSLLGLGALLATSATLFALLKWIGAAYLIYLGVRMWRSAPRAAALTASATDGPAPGARVGWRVFGHAYVVTALNPKSIVFFVAFLPQFIVPHAPLLPQGAVLSTTFVLLAGANALGYALLVGTLRRTLQRPRTLRALTRASGGVLIGAGVLTAALRRTG